MSEQGSGIGGRKGPIAWGGLALLFLCALLGSISLADAAVEASERDAIDRAEDVAASIVAYELTPELVLRDITGEEYRTLIVAVQAGILSDDQVVAVRVWRSDGDLIFSTAQRDETGEILALDDPQIQAAAAGEIVSVLSTEIEPAVGLHRVTEELFQTYVPVHLVSESFVDAVVEIDERYGSIRGEALVLWRPLQFLLAGLFVGALGLAARSMLRRTATEAAPDGSQVVVPVVRSGDRALAKTQDSLRAGERRAEEAEQRLKDGERGNAAAAPPRPGRGLEELDLKLRAAEAEREQHTGEIQLLRSSLAEKEADLALAREGNGSTKAEAKKTNRIMAEADRRATEAEQKATAAERRAMEATQRAVDASGRTLEMEAQVRELEDKLAKVGTPAETSAPTKRRDGGERKAAAELKKTNDELTKTKAELQNAKAELQSASTQLLTARSELGREADMAAAETDLDATIDLQSFEHRVSSLRAGLESANDMGWEDQPHPAPPDPPAVPVPRSDPEPAERGRELDPDEEGLSLRERLARAAAARHRGPLS